MFGLSKLFEFLRDMNREELKVRYFSKNYIASEIELKKEIKFKKKNCTKNLYTDFKSILIRYIQQILFDLLNIAISPGGWKVP